MIIGREKEKKILEKAYKDEYSRFIAIYGRRRIGKTFLVRETFEDKIVFQHTGIYEGTLKQQLLAFDSSLDDYGCKINKKSQCWIDAFNKLKSIIKESSLKRKVIFIDELSWMDTPKSDLLKALENFWNTFASARKDVLLVICSSATSWIIKKVIHNKGGLYNRLTDNIHLEFFTLGECEEYLKAKNIVMTRKQILDFYMVFGGVPFYWSFIEKGYSTDQNIDKILFSKDSILKDEFDYLYSSIFKNPDIYIKIIEALGTKKVGMNRNEIIEATNIINSGDLTNKLEELESCGFIRGYSAFGKEKKGKIYQLIDNFTLFYFKFLKNKTNDEHFWSNQINTPLINTWRGLAFERVCLMHIGQIKNKLGILGVLTDTNSWYCQKNLEEGVHGSQIDLLIVRKDQVINLCEMKYSNSDYAITENFDISMRNKISDLQVVTKTKYAIYPTLITIYGLESNMYYSTIQSVVVLDDLFKII